MKSTEELEAQLNLPKRCEIPSFEELHVYGISSIIANEVGLIEVPNSKATWQHGWHFEPLDGIEELLSGPNSTDGPRLVCNKKVENLVRLHNNRLSVHSVGLPFIYADVPVISRQKQSLLVLPPHSLPWTHHDRNELEYVDFIKSIESNFESVVVCLNNNCFERNFWRESFASAGIPVIRGADAMDGNSLHRMQRIFRSFDFVTSNTIGSHILYASYCNCRVSIAGPYEALNPMSYRNDPFFSSRPQLLELHTQRHSETIVRSFYPELFVNPEQAVSRVSWAEQEIGLQYKLEFVDLATLLGWKIKRHTSRSTIAVLKTLIRRMLGKKSNVHV